MSVIPEALQQYYIIHLCIADSVLTASVLRNYNIYSAVHWLPLMYNLEHHCTKFGAVTPKYLHDSALTNYNTFPATDCLVLRYILKLYYTKFGTVVPKCLHDSTLN